jgi:hypothetical protein
MRLRPLEVGLGHAPLSRDAFVDQGLAVGGESIDLRLSIRDNRCQATKLFV